MAIVALGLAYILAVPMPSVHAVTVTITGWLVPDTAHLNYGLVPILMSLGGAAALTLVPLTFKVRGDTIVYLSLIGLLLGSIGADLTNGSTVSQTVPFALILIPGVLLFLWWYSE
jgi:hypothetical protein